MLPDTARGTAPTSHLASIRQAVLVLGPMELHQLFHERLLDLERVKKGVSGTAVIKPGGACIGTQGTDESGMREKLHGVFMKQRLGRRVQLVRRRREGRKKGWARLTGGAHHFCVRAAAPPPASPVGGVIGERGTAARREGKNALGVCSGGAPRTCMYLHESVHLLNVILGRQWCLRRHRWSVSGEAAAEGPVPCGWSGRKSEYPGGRS